LIIIPKIIQVSMEDHARSCHDYPRSSTIMQDPWKIIQEQEIAEILLRSWQVLTRSWQEICMPGFIISSCMIFNARSWMILGKMLNLERPTVPWTTNILIGRRSNFICECTRLVPMVILYEYFTAWPLYDGGAFDGIFSLYKTGEQEQSIRFQRFLFFQMYINLQS